MHYRPIFIGGCDRSGTTLLGDLLGASTEALATPESQYVHDFVHRLASDGFATPLEAATWLQGHFRFAVWELGVCTETLAAKIDLADARATVDRIIRAYVERYRPEKAGVGVWIDHTPDNFKHYSLLKSVFPDARFVHIVRDGRAVFSSIKDLDWGPNNAYMASRYWSERLRQATTVEIAEASGCVVVRYEDLVANPATELARISAALGLPFDPAQVAGGGIVLPSFTRGQHRLIGTGVDASRRDAWHAKLAPRAVATFENHDWSRVFLRKYGYPLLHNDRSAASPIRVLVYYLHEYVRYLRNRRRHKRMEERTIERQAVA